MDNLSKTRKFLSIALKITVILSAAIGTWLSAKAGSASFMGGKTVFMYFTIQSNIGIALLCAYGAYLLIKEHRISRTWYIVKFVGTVSITLTGMVFCFVLAPTMGAKAWNIQNVLTHVVVPILSVADFFVTGINADIRSKEIPYVILPPLAYAVYAGIGFACGWQFAKGINYPYFFLNWGSPAGAFGFTDSLPFMGCMWWILLLLVFLCAVGYIYLRILEKFKKAAVNCKHK